MNDPRLSRDWLARSAAIASITTAIFLVSLKTWAAWRTGSTAMLGSLADSALDLIASLVTLIGVWIAARPADADHRFGHGKAEALAAIFQVMLIVLSAAGIGWRAVTQLANGAETAAAGEGIAVSAGVCNCHRCDPAAAGVATLCHRPHAIGGDIDRSFALSV